MNTTNLPIPPPISALLLLAQIANAADIAASAQSVVPRFTSTQVSNGRSSYVSYCAACHGLTLNGSSGPALTGIPFLKEWAEGNRSADELRSMIETRMPLLSPGSLAHDQYIELTAFILSRNGFAADSDPSSATDLDMPLHRPRDAHIPSPPSPIELTLPTTPSEASAPSTSAPDDAELLSPGTDTWPMYNHDYYSQRFSPLRQIDRSNAHHLQVLCMFQAGEVGSFQASPVIYNKTLFITTPFATFALDARTCEKRWAHRYLEDAASKGASVNRGVALYRGAVFRTTPNGHLLALDMATGQLLWDVQVVDVNAGYWLSVAPVAFKGTVYIGTAGAEFGPNGHVYAFDAKSGRMRWQFDVIPQGDQSNSRSWQGGSTHGGGSIWSTMTVEPHLGLLLVPVGNPAPDFDGKSRPGDNLFTNSVVALTLDSGTLMWWLQQVPHDVHDWDTAAAPVLYAQGKTNYIAVGSKSGRLYIYNAETHALLAQPAVTTLENTDAPITTLGTHHCPGWLGGVNWNGPAYSPFEHRLFANSVDWCGTTRLIDGNYTLGAPFVGGTSIQDPIDRAHGWTHAVDATTGHVMWSRESRTPMLAGLTPTAGGVVFTGDLDGYFLVLNTNDGHELYRINTGGAIAGGISTYSIGQAQYIAVLSGNNSKTLWSTGGSATVLILGLPSVTVH